MYPPVDSLFNVNNYGVLVIQYWVLEEKNMHMANHPYIKRLN